MSSSTLAQSAVETPEALYEIGVEAFFYFYPLLTMDITRLQFTNIEAGKALGRGPMNTFSHLRAFPPADFREVVRPNFDTLYSSSWLDLRKEPVIVSVPDTNGRYYLLPLIDMWTDVFAVPGKRTSGTKAASYALVSPGWEGSLPQGVERIEATTPYVWIIARTQTNGPADYPAVHKVQDGYTVSTLSNWGKSAQPVTLAVDPEVDMKTPPLDQVNSMTGAKFFRYAAELLKLHPPHATDWSIVARLKRIGIEPGKSFEFGQLDRAAQETLDQAAKDGLKMMYAKLPTMARIANGWQMNTDTMGVYGNYYLKRAIVAMVGLGANQEDDAVYPLCLVDNDGKQLTGDQNYVLHFGARELPPVEAFWSITMYDEAGFQVANPINRFAIGDRDALSYNADGSLDIYIQHSSPGSKRETNWLPSPAKGPLGMTMRLYAPKLSVRDGSWVPPAVQRTK
jgi:hypothetical protein